MATLSSYTLTFLGKNSDKLIQSLKDSQRYVRRQALNVVTLHSHAFQQQAIRINSRRRMRMQAVQDIESTSRQELMHEAMQRLTDDDIQSVVEKYNLEEEFFGEIDFCQINTFTDAAFGGNPAAVIYLPYERDDQWMQLIAKEFNLSETAFLVRRRGTSNQAKTGNSFSEGEKTHSKQNKKPLIKTDGQSLKPVKTAVEKNPSSGNEFNLRSFTPVCEVRLCGHATLASAHLLFSTGLVKQDNIVFHTKSGPIQAKNLSDVSLAGDDRETEMNEGFVSSETEGGMNNQQGSESDPRPRAMTVIELCLPIEPPSVSASDRNIVREALGALEVNFVGRTALNDIIVELESEEVVVNLQPDITKILSIAAGGVCITARASDSSEYDFVSRFFTPRFGVDEDPVSGGVHCSLGPYWAEKLGKSNLHAYQASKRGGHMHIRVDQSAGRVYLKGSSVMLMAGVLLTPASRVPQKMIRGLQ